MDPLVLDTVTFWEVIWWMVWLFILVMAFWVFIGIVADIFSRKDLSGIVKAAWLVCVFVFPLLGCLTYVVARPRDPPTTVDQGPAGYSSVAEITQAQQLMQSGAVSQTEFELIKQRALR